MEPFRTGYRSRSAVALPGRWKGKASRAVALDSPWPRGHNPRERPAGAIGTDQRTPAAESTIVASHQRSADASPPCEAGVLWLAPRESLILARGCSAHRRSGLRAELHGAFLK